MSNEVLSGHRQMDSIKVSYEGLKGHGVNVVHDTVTDIDAAGKMVKTAGGQSFAYDRCIVAPGISFKDNIEGYDAAAMRPCHTPGRPASRPLSCASSSRP